MSICYSNCCLRNSGWSQSAMQLLIFIKVSDKRNINHHYDINGIIIYLQIIIITMMSRSWQYKNWISREKKLFSSISPTFWSLQAPCWTHRRNKVYFTCKYLLKACIKDRSTKTFNLKKMQKWFSVMITTLMSKWWHQYFFWCRHHAIDYNNNGSNALIIDQGVSITLCYVLSKDTSFDDI